MSHGWNIPVTISPSSIWSGTLSGKAAGEQGMHRLSGLSLAGGRHSDYHLCGDNLPE